MNVISGRCSLLMQFLFQLEISTGEKIVQWELVLCNDLRGSFVVPLFGLFCIKNYVWADLKAC